VAAAIISSSFKDGWGLLWMGDRAMAQDECEYTYTYRVDARPCLERET
jgi:hypothetical protein